MTAKKKPAATTVTAKKAAAASLKAKAADAAAKKIIAAHEKKKSAEKGVLQEKKNDECCADNWVTRGYAIKRWDENSDTLSLALLTLSEYSDLDESQWALDRNCYRTYREGAEGKKSAIPSGDSSTLHLYKTDGNWMTAYGLLGPEGLSISYEDRRGHSAVAFIPMHKILGEGLAAGQLMGDVDEDGITSLRPEGMVATFIAESFDEAEGEQYGSWLEARKAWL